MTLYVPSSLEKVSAVSEKCSHLLAEAFIDSRGVCDHPAMLAAFQMLIAAYYKTLLQVETKGDVLKMWSVDCAEISGTVVDHLKAV